MQSEVLIQSLIGQSEKISGQVKMLKGNDLQLLTWRENPDSWSVLACLEHLNLYTKFYLPQIENLIINSTTKNEVEFKSGRIGNYFAKIMLPKEKLNKMKTFRSKNPLSSNLDKRVIDEFLNGQIELIDLLRKSRKISLNKLKVKTAISGFIKLNLGDTFQFIINHNIRHLKQIEIVLIESKMAESLLYSPAFPSRALINSLFAQGLER